MDGLECSEVQLTETLENKDFRIDSAFYTTKLIKNKDIEYGPIGDYLLSSQYGVSIAMNEEKNGYPIYRMNEIHNMLCDLDVDKYAELSPNEFDKFELSNGDVLFNRTNSYEWVGRTGIYYSNESGTPHTFASYLVRFNPNPKVILPEYLATFLNTKYGVADIKRRARQSINQTNVNPEEVKEMLIPLLRGEIQNMIRDKFLLAHQNRIRASNLYSQAEQCLLLELGMEAFAPSEEAVSVKSLSNSFHSSGRLDAEYYQPKYEEIEAKLHTFETTIIPSEFFAFKNSCSDYCEDGTIGVVKTKQLTNYGVNEDTESYLTLNVALENNLSFIKSGDVLFASMGVGSLGKASLYYGSTKLVTDSTLKIYRQKPTAKVLAEVLTLFLQSSIGQNLIYKFVVGSTGIINIYDKDIASIPIPVLPMEIQRDIAEKVQQSFGLRHQSEQLLETAKQAVEMAIELGETTAVEWLKETC